MSNTKSVMKLVPSIVALTTFSCVDESFMGDAEKDFDPAGEVTRDKSNNLPLVRVGNTQIIAGPNSAGASNSGGTDFDMEFDFDGPTQSSGVSYAHAGVAAAVSGASAQVASTVDAIGGGGTCGSLMVQGAAAMIGMATSSSSPDVWSPSSDFQGAATTNNQTFRVLDTDCTTGSGRQAIASGSVQVSGLPTPNATTMTASATAGGSGVWVTCPQGLDSCSTRIRQQTVAPCSEGSSTLCTFMQETITPGGTGGATAFSFLTSVGAEVSLSANVNGTGGSWNGIPVHAGVDVTTSTSITVAPL
jgi:hypothetical protein